VKSNIFRQLINNCNISDVARDVCTFLQSCEIAVTLHQFSLFEVAFLIALLFNVKFVISKQNLSGIGQEKRK